MRPNRQTGFTLIELLIVLAISSVLLIGLMTLFDWHNKVFVFEQADVKATGSARNSLNNMTEYIAQGTFVMAWRTVNGTTYTTDNDTLVLELPSLSNTGNFIAGSYDYVVFYLSNGSLYQVTDFNASSTRTKTDKKLAENVQTFSLTYDTVDPTQASTIAIDLQTSEPARGTTVSAHVTDTILLRNH